MTRRQLVAGASVLALPTLIKAGGPHSAKAPPGMARLEAAKRGLEQFNVKTTNGVDCALARTWAPRGGSRNGDVRLTNRTGDLCQLGAGGGAGCEDRAQGRYGYPR